jgi:hypothetical protein
MSMAWEHEVAPVDEGSPASSIRTRRALLGAGVAAVAATVTGALSPAAALAGADDNADMYVGIHYGDVQWTTAFTNFRDNAEVFKATSTNGGTAITGTSGSGVAVRAATTSGLGVWATSSTNIAVAAGSTYHHAVYAETYSQDWAAVIGWNRGGTAATGVQGYAGSGSNPPNPRPHTGVMGTAAGAGTGGYFASDTGNALHVAGKAKFNRSGVASIGANKTYVDVTVPGGLSGSPGIVATLQRKRGTAYVAAVRVNYPSAGKARIYLNKVASSSASTPVSWFAFD